jgi:heptosyltransferase-2
MSWRKSGRLGPVYRFAGAVAELGIALTCADARPIDAEVIRSIFVLRNNDIGDLLVTTPLFDALRRRFPAAHITAAIGPWNMPLLANNPHVSEAIPLNAPWYNHFVPSRSVGDALRFIYRSPEIEKLSRRQFDLGIDVLGSHWGTLLLHRINIPRRIGVKGYAGGHSGTSEYYCFDEMEHVSRANLHVAELLGATDMPEGRPQIFLSADEQREAEAFWCAAGEPGRGVGKRVILNLGGKPDRRWPFDHLIELTGRLAVHPKIQLAVAGGPQDVDRGVKLQHISPAIACWAGKHSLRQTFAVTAASDLVISSDSMLGHVAAAFCRPTLVLLGSFFESASRNAALWGYPAPARMVGREGLGTEIATPADAERIAMEMLRV